MAGTLQVEVLLYRGKGPLSSLIRWQTRSNYAHAAFNFHGRVIESLPWRGVICRAYHPSDNIADKFTVDLTSEVYEQLLAWATSQVGRRYDWQGVLGFVSRRKLLLNDRWFCSEFVFYGLAQVGKPLFVNTEAWEAHPGLLVRSSVLRRLDPVHPSILEQPNKESAMPLLMQILRVLLAIAIAVLICLVVIWVLGLLGFALPQRIQQVIFVVVGLAAAIWAFTGRLH